MSDDIVRRTKTRHVATAIGIGIWIGSAITVLLPFLAIVTVKGDGSGTPSIDFAFRVVERAQAFLNVSLETTLLVCGLVVASVSSALVYLALERISRPKT